MSHERAHIEIHENEPVDRAENEALVKPANIRLPVSRSHTLKTLLKKLKNCKYYDLLQLKLCPDHTEVWHVTS